MTCRCQGSSYSPPEVQAQRSAARRERRERRPTNISDPSYFAGAPTWNGPQPKKVTQPTEAA